jgi:histidyl-tRNA synthetase
VNVDLAGGKLKTQMKRADQSGAIHVMVLGADEIASHRGHIKNMRSGDSSPVVLFSTDIACMIKNA